MILIVIVIVILILILILILVPHLTWQVRGGVEGGDFLLVDIMLPAKRD